MAQQTIDIGTNDNDGTGDKLRDAMRKVNANFAELYSQASQSTNLSLGENLIQAVNTNGNITLDPNGSGTLLVTTGAIFNTSHQPSSTLLVKDSLGGNVVVVDPLSRSVGINTTASGQGLAVSGNLSVVGTTALIEAEVTLGSPTKHISFAGALDSSILPTVTGSYNLGSSSLRFNDVYSQQIDVVTATSINISATGISAGNVTVTGDTTAGNLVIRNNEISNNIANQDIQINPYGTGNLVVNTRMVVGQGTSPIGAAIIKAVENVDGFVESVIQNLNSGAGSSADFFVPADNGSDDNYFVDLGINSSNYSDPVDYAIHTPGSGYLYTAGADLFIGTLDTTKDLTIHAGGFNYSNIALRIKGNTGHIIAGKENGSPVVDTGEHLQVKGSARFASTVAIASRTPSSAVGASGDKAGMIAYDSSYFYVCKADYDGVTKVWTRASISTW